MTATWTTPAWVPVVLLVVLVAVAAVLIVMLVGLRRARAEARASSDTAERARVDVERLRATVAALEQQVVTSAQRTPAAGAEYRITALGDPDAGGQESAEAATGATPGSRVDGPVFADLVLRESAVQAVSLAAGVRRALAPEHRSRIRYAMRREVKRARKQRRADLRAARRDVERAA